MLARVYCACMFIECICAVPLYNAVIRACLQAMGTIHGILPGDKVITNVDVFRKLYETVGLGWVYAITRWAPINNLANRWVPHITWQVCWSFQQSCLAVLLLDCIKPGLFVALDCVVQLQVHACFMS